MKERAIALFLAIASACLFLNAQSIPGPRWEPLGAGFMAKTVTGGLFLLGCILAYQAFRAPGRAKGTGFKIAAFEDGLAKYALTLKLFGSLIFYLVALEIGEGPISYFVASIVFFMICAVSLDQKILRSATSLMITFAAAVVLCGFVGWGFSQVLHVSLP